MRKNPLTFVLLYICNRHFTIITKYCRYRATIHYILSSNVPSVWKQTGFDLVIQKYSIHA